MSETPSATKTHYEILRIAPDASPEALRAAYRRMSSRFHPDRHPRHSEAAARIMASINVAYDVLSDPVRRADYDHALRSPPRPEPVRAWPPRAPGPSPGPWRPEVDPAPFFGVHRDAAVETSTRRRAMAVRRMMAASALCCAAGLAIGAWMIFAPGHDSSADDDKVLFDVRNDARVASAAPASSAQRPAEPPLTDGVRRARPLDRSHIRPLEAPNGSPWPAFSGELSGYMPRFNDGEAVLTLDNRIGPSDVFAKLYRKAENGLTPARHVFVRARDQWTVDRLRPGEYEVRYMSLDSGQTLRSIRLILTAPSPNSTAQTFRVDDMQGRSGRATPISRDEFQAPALRLRLSREPSGPAAGVR